MYLCAFLPSPSEFISKSEKSLFSSSTFSSSSELETKHRKYKEVKSKLENKYLNIKYKTYHSNSKTNNYQHSLPSRSTGNEK